MKSTKLVSWLKPFLVLSIICSFALTATAQNYYPAEIGNTWTLDTTDGTQQRRYVIEDAEDSNGLDLRRLKIDEETLGTSAIVPDRYLISVDDTGITLHRSDTDEGTFGIATIIYDPPTLFYPSLPMLGQTWEISGETELLLVGATSNTTTIEVVGFEEVVTPAGTFENCAKIRISYKITTALLTLRPVEHLWLAPDVGPVRFQNQNEIDFDLVSYSLVAPAAEEMVEEPTVEEPMVEEPTVEEPADEEPTVEEPTVEEPTVEEPTVEEPTVEEPTVEEPMVEEPTVEEPTVEEPTVEEPTVEEPTVEEPTVEEPTAPKTFSFDLSLESGLNMISIPLMPEKPYTAKSLAEMLNATMVIQFDTITQKFVGYTITDESDGFGIDGGMGYIVNTPAGGMATFTGKAWDNQPEMEEPMDAEPMAEEPAAEEEMAEEEMVEEPAAEEEMAEEEMVEEEMMDEEEMTAEEVAEEPATEEEVAAAPALSTFKSAWAFIVTSDVRGMQAGTAYTLVAENLRTGTIATENITSDVKRSSAVWADLNRKSVVEAGDKLEIALYDERGNIVSGPFQRTVTTADIRNAFLSLQLNVGDVQPKDTILAQNFPNPFNPETWIPYQLSQPAEVSISIHNIAGQLVRTLDLGLQPIGSYMTPGTAAYWDGKNAVGERVSSGIYFYTLQTAEFTATRRMVILK